MSQKHQFHASKSPSKELDIGKTIDTNLDVFGIVFKQNALSRMHSYFWIIINKEIKAFWSNQVMLTSKTLISWSTLNKLHKLLASYCIFTTFFGRYLTNRMLFIIFCTTLGIISFKNGI